MRFEMELFPHTGNKRHYLRFEDKTGKGKALNLYVVTREDDEEKTDFLGFVDTREVKRLGRAAE